MFISSSKRNSLRKAYKDRFLIGSAIGPGLNRKHVRILRRHFNSITPEDCMKMIWVQQKQGVYNFAKADEFVRFGKRNGMTIIGHSLVWGLKNPEIFFTDNVGNLISKEELTERMRNYIHLVVNRYKKYIKCWDVVNEVLKDNGEFINNRFFEILGEDYVKLAFRFAREADPDAILYFNELKLSMPEKRAGAVRMIKKLQADGVRVDGVGIQTHCNMSFPDINEVEKTIVAFSELGCRISITEMDMSVLPVFNPF
ncbi:MAG: endo-1,4-beta-xylanase, partial [Dysgonamonadaceae bacterium]|nr:endo-1,4-beta-xylanase [Dysgonamonadaceae bacterium]